jgi:hypothetical protein
MIKRIIYKNETFKNDFDDIINNQINNIKLIINHKGDYIKLKDIDYLFINDKNEVYSHYNHTTIKLFTETGIANTYEPFNTFFFNKIAIDHVVPMKKLLDDYSDRLNGLNKLTAILKQNKIFKYNNSRKRLAKITNSIIENDLLEDFDLKLIIDDLKFLDSKTELQLMCSTENLKKKKR